jgi:alkylation response protein AidB-like acyl-CoA dehydrogenase
VTNDPVSNRLAQLLDELTPGQAVREVRRRQYELGLAWVHFPVGSGGLAADPDRQREVDEALAARGIASPMPQNLIGIGLAAPTIAEHGTDEQRSSWLGPAFVLDELWCQLFSEPGAGSDLAGLRTAAVRDGDDWVVNGQKVWTSFAHKADRGLLLARTDPDVPKHRGLTCFVLDMHSAGVDVRPLRQMTGGAEFNEVYLTDVVVPDRHRLGPVGSGWQVALTTLMNERNTLGGDVLAMSDDGLIDPALALWAQEQPDDPVLADRLVDLWVEAEAHRLLKLQATTGAVGPAASVGKMVAAELNQRVTSWMMDVLGPKGLGFPGYAAEPEHGERPPGWSFLRARANTIEGGTTEVMLNILGERVLGLPGDVRVDKDVPWRNVPRS